MMKRRSFLKAAAAGLLVFPAAGSALAQTPFAPEDIKVPRAISSFPRLAG